MASPLEDIASKKEFEINTNKERTKSKAWVSAAFLLISTSIGFLAGFGQALAATKKAHSSVDSVVDSKAARVHAEGVALATRALTRGSVWALGGSCGVGLAIWVLTGCPKSFLAFRTTVGSILPSIPKKEAKEGERVDFESITDFLTYLIEKDDQLREEKKKEEHQ